MSHTGLLNYLDSLIQCAEQGSQRALCTTQFPNLTRTVHASEQFDFIKERLELLREAISNSQKSKNPK